MAAARSSRRDIKTQLAEYRAGKKENRPEPEGLFQVFLKYIPYFTTHEAEKTGRDVDVGETAETAGNTEDNGPRFGDRSFRAEKPDTGRKINKPEVNPPRQTSDCVLVGDRLSQSNNNNRADPRGVDLRVRQHGNDDNLDPTEALTSSDFISEVTAISPRNDRKGNDLWTHRFLILVLKLALWCLLMCLFVKVQFGCVFVIVSSMYVIYTNTGTRRRGEKSAYSVFNPECERLQGTYTAEQFEREILFRR